MRKVPEPPDWGPQARPGTPGGVGRPGGLGTGLWETTTLSPLFPFWSPVETRGQRLAEPRLRGGRTHPSLIRSRSHSVICSLAHVNLASAGTS